MNLRQIALIRHDLNWQRLTKKSMKYSKRVKKRIKTKENQTRGEHDSKSWILKISLKETTVSNLSLQ